MKALFLGAFLLSSCGGGGAPTTTEDPKVTSYPMVEGVKNDEGLSYEIFVSAYADSNGDGCGDFRGIAAKADYIASLGVNQVWLMPIHSTSSYHGYDVNDYYSVNSKFGTMEDFVYMVNTLKAKGVDVIIDMVLNHSGKANPWFTKSYQDMSSGYEGEDSKADWYAFSEEPKTGYYAIGDYYYEARFDASMPEFNWDSQSWRKEVRNILKFWLDKGVKGFRLDAVLYYYYGDDARSGEVCRYLRECIQDEYPDVYFVGEGWTKNNLLLNHYFPSGLGSFFDFSRSNAYDNTFVRYGKGFQDGSKFAKELENYITKIKEADPKAVPSFFLSNHDTDRLSNNFDDDNYLKMTHSTIYLMPGTPFIYYGEEENLFGTRGNEGTDGMRRLPMVWSDEGTSFDCNVPDRVVSGIANAAKPWAEKGIEQLEKDPMSILNHLRKVGNVRNRLKGIKNGTIEAIDTGEKYVMAYRLLAKANYRIYHNSDSDPITLEIGNGLTVFDSIDTTGVRPVYKDGQLTLNSYSTVIFQEALGE